MKIITKEITWKETQNPHVDALMCPFCKESGVVLEPSVVLADNPVQHVNLGKVRGKLLTLQGKCHTCGNKFLWRMMFLPQGTYSWLDVAVSAAKFNELLATNSTEQLPCMCENCVKEGKVTTAYDETYPAPAPPQSIPISHAPCPSKQIYPAKPGQPPKVPKAATPIKPTEDVKMPDDLEEALKQVMSPTQAAGMLATGAAKIRQLTDAQIALVAKEMNTDFNAIATKGGITLEQAQEHFTQLIEAYVRIKFATFQPTPSSKPNVPPSFPTIVPTKVFDAFNAQKNTANFCQFIISRFFLVDHALNRQDLPANVIWNHMCPMCSVKTCTFHPVNRKDS